MQEQDEPPVDPSTGPAVSWPKYFLESGDDVGVSIVNLGDFVCLCICRRVEVIEYLFEGRSDGFFSPDRRLIVDQEQRVAIVEI